MMTRHEECQQLRTQISELDTNITQMQDLLRRTPSAGLQTALDSETQKLHAARTRLARLEAIIAIEESIQQVQATIAQQEQQVQQLRDEREAAQRRLTEAETALNRTRIELSQKQGELSQKQGELDQAPAAPAAAAAAPQAQIRPGATVRLTQTPTAVLRLENGAEEPLPGASAIIGREKVQGVDVALNDQTVSGTHAQISYSDMAWSITDLNSANGTWVNGQRLSPHTPTSLESGAALTFGLVKATFDSSD